VGMRTNRHCRKVLKRDCGAVLAGFTAVGWITGSLAVPSAACRWSSAIQAPKSMAHSFDACGRPLPEYWGEDASSSLPFQNQQIHVARDPATQAALNA